MIVGTFTFYLSEERVEDEVEGSRGASGFQTLFFDSDVKDQQQVLVKVRKHCHPNC